MAEYEKTIPQQYQGRNVVVVVSRTGSYEEFELTPEQLEYIRYCARQFPKPEK